MTMQALAEMLAEGTTVVPIDWPMFWATDHKAEDWLCEPILPRGRAVATYSPAKTGKSLLALDVAARLATGTRVLDQPAGDPIHVDYYDLEMTEDDLAERLVDLGYGPDSDLSHLHYYLLPTLPPLDTPEGGATITALAKRDAAELLIIDTTSRVLGGEENQADTLRALYINAGLPLKAAGVTVWRLDHAGKDLSRGQRGTSAKADDVDLVWELLMRDKGLRLRATHRRQSWIPETIDLLRLEDPLRHVRAEEASWPAGTTETADLLDALGVPAGASTRDAQKALSAAGRGQRRAVVTAAVKWRRRAFVVTGTTPGTTSGEEAGTSDGNHPADSFGNHPRNHPEPPDTGIREPGSPPMGEPVTSPRSNGHRRRSPLLLDPATQAYIDRKSGAVEG